jgi:hypothetical protein
MPTQIAPGIWYHPRTETGILAGAQLQSGASQTIGRQHYSTGQELGRDNLVEWVREIDRYHKEHNGWQGFGYSFAVGRDEDPNKAHIFEGRGWGKVGAHTYGHNEDLGVCFLGNDDPGVLDATPGVRVAINLLFRSDHRGWGVRPLREVHGHRETYSTSCPGDELEAWVKAKLPVKSTPKPDPTPPKPVRPPRLVVVTGILDHPTIEAMQRVFRKEENPAQHILVDGSFGPRTKSALQHHLGLRGHLSGKAIGVIDRKTVTSLRCYLVDQGFGKLLPTAKANGTWDRDLTRRLQEALNARKF